jgi:PAS domain S-box-containing protein
MAQVGGQPQSIDGVRRLERAGRVSALAALLLGLTEIVGVAAGIDPVTEPIPGHPRMSGMAAVAFTVASLMMLVDRPSATASRRATRDVLGAVVIALAMTALLDRVFDLWPGIGMPSVPASFAMLLLSAAAFVVDRKTPAGKRPAEALGAVVALVGLVTLFGHAFGAPQLFRAPDHGTALAGSICMCLLAVSVLFARPQEGLVSLLWSPTPGGTTARRLGLAALVVIPGLGTVVLTARHYFEFEERTAFALVIAGSTMLALAVIAFTATDLDRSELDARRASAAEHEVRTLLEAVIEQMPEPVLIADEDGRVARWNAAATKARGGDDAVDARGHLHVLDLRLPSGERLKDEDQPHAQALARGEAVTGIELVLRTRDGTSLPVVASAAPLRDLDGHVRGAVALFDDISALKQLERMREEWMAVIAHDLRQPLNGIVLHAQVLRRALGPDATERQRESIEHIRVAGLRLNRMIEDLLDASRIEASRLKLERRPLALPPLVRDILARTPELSGREVHFSAQEGMPDAFADAVRIEQVVSNLLTNAAKYGDGQTAIEVHIDQDGSDLHVSVSNEGAEIEQTHLSHLFTRFYRTPSAEAGPRKGIGLGLYISKGLVEAHGGRIHAESRERRTTFHFTLPPAGHTA